MGQDARNCVYGRQPRWERWYALSELRWVGNINLIVDSAVARSESYHVVHTMSTLIQGRLRIKANQEDGASDAGAKGLATTLVCTRLVAGHAHLRLRSDAP